MIASSPSQDLQRKLIWLISIRLLVVVSITVPYYLYRPAEPLIEAEETAGPAVAAERAGRERAVGGERAAEVADDAVAPHLGETAAEAAGDVGRGSGLARLQLEQRRRDQVLQLLVAAISVLTLGYIALLRLLRNHPEVHTYLQLAGDLVVTTMLIYELGPAGSNFTILYVIVISVAALLLRRSGTVVIATFAYLLYVLVLLSPHLLTPFLDRLLALVAISSAARPPALEDMPPEQLVYDLSVHLFGFYGVAILTSYLAGGAAQAEERLRRKHRDLAYLRVFHRDVLQSISSGLATTDADGILTSLNRAGEEMLRRSEADLVGEPVTATGLFDAASWEAARERVDVQGSSRDEIALHVLDTTAVVGYTLTPLRDGDGAHRGYILIFQDLTEWRKLQEQLRIKDRMAAVGEMAAGLAHEVGNPLAAISGSVQMLGRSLHGDQAQRKLLDITLKESRRLDRTVKDFLQMAHPRERHAREFDVAALLAEDVELLRNSTEVREDHVIEARFDPPSAFLHADQDQVGQVFWNLARNALRAMPDGGRLTLTGTLLPDVYRIEIADTGRGMDEAERTNLFHPFQSFFDGGNGLGMAIVYRIVQEHRGEVVVDSAPDAGTRIRVDLPLHGSR